MLKSRVFFAALAMACSMAGTASAIPVTYTFHETSADPAFYLLVSATGYLTFDSSLFTPVVPGQESVIFKTASGTNLTAFDFVFVTSINGSNVTQEWLGMSASAIAT